MTSKRVLLAPLDWGLGHATRCIPIIHELIRQQFTVILAGNGASLSLLQQEFPALRSYSLPAYDPVYTASGTLVWVMARQIPKFVRAILREQTAVDQIAEDEKIDIILSDNRYGCWSTRTKNIFITHQVQILMPAGFGWMRGVVNWLNRKAIRKFDRCWVPDTADANNLSGKLSEPFDHPTDFIGLLSRLERTNVPEKTYDVLILLSGPEPQRSVLERLLANQIGDLATLQIALVRGTQLERTVSFPAAVTVVDFASSSMVREMMAGADVVIARSGYSTMMDLAALQKKAIFIPTPGQTEQEYLARRMEQRGVAGFAEQENFRLTTALADSHGYSGFREEAMRVNLLRDYVLRLND